MWPCLANSEAADGTDCFHCLVEDEDPLVTVRGAAQRGSSLGRSVSSGKVDVGGEEEAFWMGTGHAQAWGQAGGGWGW